MKHLNNKTWLGAVMLLSAAAGCQKNTTDADLFPPESDHRKMHQIMEAQQAAGARKDATLQAYHFTGAQLNAAGEAKLDLLVPTQPNSDVLVYLNLPDGDVTKTRWDAVSNYLNKRGVDASHVKLVAGTNPDAYVPAGDAMQRMDRIESSGDDATGGTSAQSGAAPAK